MWKQGQAAIEFLTTYSWALFILFAVVSAVYMLDLADPDRYAEPECVLDNQVSCLEAQYLMNGPNPDTIRFNLQNNYPRDINISRLYLSVESGSAETSGVLNGGNHYHLPSGTSKVISHTITSDWSEQGIVTNTVTSRLGFTFTFYPTSSGNRYNKSGFAVVRGQS